MEPNKFEETIREKLQEREMQPSSEAWEQLNAQLGNTKKSKNRIVWYAVAASLVSIIVVGSLIFSNSQAVSDGENLVTAPTNKETIDLSTEPVKASQEIHSEKIASEATTAPVSTQKNKPFQTKSVKPQPKIDKQIETLSEKNQNQTVAYESVNTKEGKTDQQPTKTEENRFVTNKVNEVVAQVKEIQHKNKEVTPAEIDALLAQAEREIKTKQFLHTETKKVDAAALLFDVEMELEKSFRDKVFDALGEGFNKVRTAVAERNE